MTAKFIHLNVHTSYSLLDSTIRGPQLMQTLKAQQMPAVAMTDQNNLFGLVKFYREAYHSGIKPIIGADIWLQNEADHKAPYRLTLLCQNMTGYQNLTRLLSHAYLKGQHAGFPQVKMDWMASHADGLIALSGAQWGDIGQAFAANKTQAAASLLKKWLRLFPDRFYVELQRLKKPQENDYLENAIQLAEKYNVPVVATNDVRFLTKEDFEAHEVRVCIHQGWTINDEKRPRLYTSEQYLKSVEEMEHLFADMPAALQNTVEIAKRCNVTLEFGENHLPNFPVPQKISINDYLETQAKEGLKKRLKQLQPQKTEETDWQEKYHQRLKFELSIITAMGFAGYFLVVADFIRWAKQHDIPVGAGRGSGAGSIVAYALEITDIDPIAYHLLFERFLNPERVSLPDFDIDFCVEGRDRVIDYVSEKYGRDSVSQIITYGSMAAKAVVRDVGRVMGYPYGYVDKIAKLVPFAIGMTLKKALQEEELLLNQYQEDDEVRRLINMALKLEGLPRNVGKHAAGVVIAPTQLTDFTPLYCEPDGTNLVTQFDKDDVETVGLVKFDFLGLRTLTIIHWALKIINAKRTTHHEKPIDIQSIPLNDEKTFALLKACQTVAVFQLESRGMRDLIKRIQPDRFNDIVALVALFRPGPLQSGMVDDFINRKHGREAVIYPHSKLASILEETYGVILYQEQVMQIAQVLAGYSLGSADILRKAMGKKKPEEMAKQRAVFLKGSEENGIEAALANQIFDLMEKFAGYGFNKAHSVAYALIAYQTAWLKAHYPAEYMAAVLSSDMDNTDKVVRYLQDVKLLELNVHPPDINESEYKFTVNSEGEIMYGLGAIKGVGAAAIESILDARRSARFTDFFSFCCRVDNRKINRKVLEAFIRAGALDSFKVHRASLLASIDKALQIANQTAVNESLGQNDLFGNDDHSEMTNIDYVDIPAWPEQKKLDGEKMALGYYLSGHPIAQYENELKQLTSVSISEIIDKNSAVDAANGSVMIAGFVTQIRKRLTKQNKRIAFITLTDREGQIDLAVFSDAYEKYAEKIEKDQLLIVKGEVKLDEYTDMNRLTVQEIMTLEEVRRAHAKHCCIKLESEKMKDFFIDKFYNIIINNQGKCPIIIDYEQSAIKAKIQLGNKFLINPNEALIDAMQALCGEDKVRIAY